VPHFTPDETQALLGWLERYFDERARMTPLYGLVLAGGRSTRMAQDKAVLIYEEKPQLERCFDLLEARCDEVFLSVHPDQAHDETRSAFPQIKDCFLDIGPMGGILTAQRTEPDAAWLVLACDLPLVEADTVDRLIANRNPYKFATAYASTRDGLPEPLCAIYEPKSYFRLLEFLANGYTCPRKVLIHSATDLVALENKSDLDNVNTPEEYQAALRCLQERRQTTP
jgi:molybdopterin-guanine dinucleotide biosynthesis protein A